MDQTFTVDDVVSQFVDADYAPERREPKEGVYYEFAVKDTVIKRAKAGHLMAKITVEARDAEDAKMFTQWINAPLPVALGDVTPPDYAKKIFLGTMRPFFPDNAAYDMRVQDTSSKKSVYLKDGQPVNGKEYDDAMIRQNRANAQVAVDMAKVFIAADDEEAPFSDLNGTRFFGRVEKKGDFTNVRDCQIQLPEGTDVVYDRTEAFG